jgi:predicted ATP-grasp superfamily ATP-dependent carboligase
MLHEPISDKNLVYSPLESSALRPSILVNQEVVKRPIYESPKAVIIFGRNENPLPCWTGKEFLNEIVNVFREPGMTVGVRPSRTRKQSRHFLNKL